MRGIYRKPETTRRLAGTISIAVGGGHERGRSRSKSEILGAMASGAACPQCGYPLRWFAEQNAWGCDRCRQMFPAQAVAPQMQHAQMQQAGPRKSRDNMDDIHKKIEDHIKPSGEQAEQQHKLLGQIGECVKKVPGTDQPPG